MNRIPRFLPVLLLLLVSTPARGDFLITEVMADNRIATLDEDNDFADWIEIINTGDAEASIDGYYLSNDPLKLDKWRFPAVTVAPGRFLLVFASGKNRRDPARELHTSFKLHKEGDKIYL